MIPSTSLAAFRFGFGLPHAAKAPLTPDAMLAALAVPDEMAARFPIVGFDWFHARTADIALNRKAADSDPALKARLDEVEKEIDRTGFKALRATLARAVDAPDALRERLVAFWADHFTVSANGKPQTLGPYTLVEDAIRPHFAGRFGDMLSAVTHHPAMLIYLNQTRSVGPGSRQGLRSGGGLNENLARELLELHTMGVGAAYSQSDVRQLAELLTGLTYDPRRGARFNARMAEPGPEEVLGKAYDGKGEAPIRAFLADLALHPDTARHVSGKLAVHFISDTPDAGLVAEMAQVWQDTGGDLAAVYAVMLRHPTAWAEPAAKARQPFDFLIAALRALGVTGAEIMDWPHEQLLKVIVLPIGAMGQRWKSPPGPDGWPEEIDTWITPQALAERIGWGMRWPATLAPLPDPAALADRALGDRASAATKWAVVRAETEAEGVGLVFASPEFNRR